MASTRHTCLKLQIPKKSNQNQQIDSIFVKATWFSDHFEFSVTDGFNAWTCQASEDEVSERASQWDQPVADYIELAERYLGFQQPGSVYGFADAGDGHKRLSWTFEKEGTKLEWRWKCKPSTNSKETTAEILDFLMDANIQLSNEVVRLKRGVEMMTNESAKCLEQSKRFSHEKEEFESAIYAKFLGVLNTKKSKLRELRDQLSKKETSGKMPMEEDEEESTDKTESFDEKTDESEEDVPISMPRGRKRK